MNNNAPFTAGMTSAEIDPHLTEVPDRLPGWSSLNTGSPGRIVNLDSLREHLQWAIGLEHFTIPPYLCALYSLDAARNPEAAEVVSSVLVEKCCT